MAGFVPPVGESRTPAAALITPELSVGAWAGL